MNGARITAIGTYVPEKRLTNADLEQMVETSNEWIVQRTGIRERRISRDDEFTSDLCVAAVKAMMRRYGKTVADVDMVIVATSTPDFPFPSVASLIQEKLQIIQTGAIDLNAACAGFVYGLHTAYSYVASGLHKKVLVVGADTLSKVTDYTDRSTCVLFGDGAGAVLVEKDERSSSFKGALLGSDGSGAQHIYQTGLAKKIGEMNLVDTGHLVQNGREVFRWVVRNVPKSIEQMVKQTNTSLEQIDWFIPHSANLRLIEPICEKLGFPLENTLHSLVPFGNTSAATIPLALDLGLREGKVKNGDLALLYGFGAGLAHAGQLLKIDFDDELHAPAPL